MKKASITWETVVKLIIALVVLGILVAITFLFKERIFDLFNAIKSTMGYGGP